MLRILVLSIIIALAIVYVDYRPRASFDERFHYDTHGTSTHVKQRDPRWNL